LLDARFPTDDGTLIEPRTWVREADIRRIPGDFEARIALLTGSGNGKLPSSRTEAIKAGC
jgi:hypothetical protein